MPTPARRRFADNPPLRSAIATQKLSCTNPPDKNSSSKQSCIDLPNRNSMPKLSGKMLPNKNSFRCRRAKGLPTEIRFQSSHAKHCPTKIRLKAVMQNVPQRKFRSVLGMNRGQIRGACLNVFQRELRAWSRECEAQVWAPQPLIGAIWFGTRRQLMSALRARQTVTGRVGCRVDSDSTPQGIHA